MIRSTLIVVACLMCCSSVQAQEPAELSKPTAIDGVSPSENPELWVYLQEMRRYDDPKTTLRENAIQRAAYRRARLESQKWYGYSPLRPAASPIPTMGEAAPHWVGNGLHPAHWVSASAFYSLRYYR